MIPKYLVSATRKKINGTAKCVCLNQGYGKTRQIVQVTSPAHTINVQWALKTSITNATQTRKCRHIDLAVILVRSSTVSTI